MDKNSPPERAQSQKQVLLSEEQYHQISGELDLLRAKLKSRLVLFGDLNGQLISQKGDLPGVDMPILAALIGSDFSATFEIARLLGKNNQFRMHFHEGTDRHLYISSVGEQFFLAVIFDPSVTLGMVRIFTQKSIDKITKIIETNFDEMVKISNIIDAEFKSYVSNGLDKILD